MTQDASHETIVVNPRTGGRKGTKPERFSLLPWDALTLVSLQVAARSDALGGALESASEWWQGGHVRNIARATRYLLRALDPSDDGNGVGLAALPWRGLLAVARTYHEGATKYHDDEVGPHNWRRGYAWSLSFDAFGRHVAWHLAGERLNDTGLPHLAHAAWHGLALGWFALHMPEHDDRPHVWLGRRQPPQ